MSWDPYLEPLKQHSTGAAIITQQGALCAQCGTWKASQAELQTWAPLIVENSPALSSGITYAGEKFFCNQASAESVVAQKAKSAVVLFKSNTLYVAGFTDGSKIVPAELSAQVAKVADNLKKVGY